MTLLYGRMNYTMLRTTTLQALQTSSLVLFYPPIALWLPQWLYGR